MKKLPIISASLLLGTLVISSCSTNKMALNGAEDNMYFMASDVKLATKYAVDNNNPQSFKNIAEEPTLAEENFSSRNVNPEYISRYQASSSTTTEDGVVYFDEGTPASTGVGNINAYDNFYSNGNTGFNSNGPNVNVNFGMGFGSPWGMGFGSPWGMGFYDPFWDPWAFRPGFSVGMGWGFGNPFWGPSFGMGGFWGPSFGMGMGGFWGPSFGMGMGGFWGPNMGWGMPIYGGRPIFPGNPSFILPGSEFGDRRVVHGARPSRGSSLTNSGIRSNAASVVPNTARAQARNNASAANSSRRLESSENARTASRDFGNSQNDYYNSGRSRMTETRNVNSPAADRSVSTRSGSSIPSARPSSGYNPGSSTRTYTGPSRSSSGYDGSGSAPSYNRQTNPSYNRSTSPSYNDSRSSNPSYNRSTTPSYDRSYTPSRSNSNSSSYSAPSRMSTGGGSSYSAPSRSSGGSSGGYSGGSSGGSRGGRGN